MSVYLLTYLLTYCHVVHCRSIFPCRRRCMCHRTCISLAWWCMTLVRRQKLLLRTDISACGWRFSSFTAFLHNAYTKRDVCCWNISLSVCVSVSLTQVLYWSRYSDVSVPYKHLNSAAMQRNSPGAARDGGPVVLRSFRVTPRLVFFSNF